MPKTPRSTKEIQNAREDILAQAVALINERGYEAFNMRALGKRLGVAAKTVYNYFRNKDELYLAVLARGFTRLAERCRNAGSADLPPWERVRAMARAFVNFGLENPGYHNLMFTWQVPKYEDYADTPLEPLARVELEASLGLYELFVSAARELAGEDGALSGEDARFFVTYFFCLAHGYVSATNNTLLSYMHEDPASLRDRVVDTLMEDARRRLGNTAPTGPANP